MNPSVHIGHEEITSFSIFDASDGGQNPQSLICACCFVMCMYIKLIYSKALEETAILYFFLVRPQFLTHGLVHTTVFVLFCCCSFILGGLGLCKQEWPYSLYCPRTPHNTDDLHCVLFLKAVQDTMLLSHCKACTKSPVIGPLTTRNITFESEASYCLQTNIWIQFCTDGALWILASITYR